MQRRTFLGAGAASLLPLSAGAHHGWSGFDQNQPIYLEGTAASVAWRNPHAEVILTVSPGLRLPADLAGRPIPAQATPVDAGRILAAARPPRRDDAKWEIELAPLTRLRDWQVAEIKPGDRVAVVGYTFGEEKGEAVLRAEFLFVAGKAYPLRSSPA